MFEQILAFFNDSQVEINTWLVALIGVFVSAKAITVITPTNVDNKIVDGILTVLNFLALNVFKDKNADSKTAEKK